MAANHQESTEKKIIPGLFFNLDHVRNKLGSDKLADYLPEEIIPYKDAIAKVCGSQYSAFTLNTIIALAAVFPYSSTPLLGAKFTGLSKGQTRLLNGIGLSPAGIARITMGALTDRGYGEIAATIFQIMGILGTASAVALLYQYDDNDFANATIGSELYFLTMLSNIFTSMPLGCYPKIADIARQSPKNAETRETHLREISEITAVSMGLSGWQKKLTDILGKGPIKNIALASAIANTGPGWANAIPLIMPEKFGLIAVYFAYLSIQILLLIASRTYRSSSYQVQLQQEGISAPKDREIAEYLGQESKPPEKFLQDLTMEEQVSILDASILYAAFYSILVLMCLSGKEILQQNMSTSIATLMIISIADISSLCRLIPAYYLFGLTPSQFTLVALAIMTVTSLIVQLSPENAIWSFLLFAVANGCGNGVVINKLTEEASKQVAAGTALSTGIALILAFPFVIAEASFHEIILVICAATLAYSVAREVGWKPDSALRALSLFDKKAPISSINPSDSAAAEEKEDLEAPHDISGRTIEMISSRPH